MALLTLLGGRLPIQPIVAPGWLSSKVTLSRAQASGARSTALGADGVTWVEYVADAPRFHGVARGLLIEGQRTNTFSNPRMEGGTPGTPGTPPTAVQAWGATVGGAGLSAEYVGPVTAAGLPGSRWRLTGTPTLGGAVSLNLAPTNSGWSASPGQTWTGSFSLAMAAGSAAGISQARCAISSRVGTGTLASTTGTNVLSSLSAAPTPTSLTLADLGATASGIMHAVRLDTVQGVPVDITIDVPAVQIEANAAFASTPTLPPVGTPGASTRGADAVSTPLSAWGIPSSGACTLLWSGVVLGVTDLGRLLSISDGTTSNSVELWSSGGNFLVSTTRAGVTVSSSSLGAVPVGTPIRASLMMSRAGRARAVVEAASGTASAAGALSGLTNLYIGNRADGVRPLHAEHRHLRVLPFDVPDSAQSALLAALPLS